MSAKLHITKGSPPCRASLLTLKAINAPEVELVEVNLLQKEHLSTEFVKMNPHHTVPTLEGENGFAVWDSHAINAYLVAKYAKDNALYPQELEKRAIIDQRLHFDSNILSTRLGAIAAPIIKDGAKSVTKDKADAMVQGYTQLETLLEHGNKYVAGKELSIADFSIVATISTANVLVPLASNRFPKTLEWLNRMQQLPYYAEANQEGLNMFTTFIKSKMVR